MAKQRKGLKSTLNLGEKVSIGKKPVTKDIDKIAKKLVDENPSEVKEKNVRLSVDVPETMYKAIKMKVFTEGKTVRKYMIDLINNDLKL